LGDLSRTGADNRAANAFLHQEIMRWGQVVRANHIEVEQ
jgi:hypothetical protein